jgi:nucleotide-binding universal stress UspA family protein
MSKKLYRRILLVVDPSDASLQAARRAVDLAAAFGSKITALSVVDVDTLGRLLRMRILVQDEVQDFEKDMEQNCHKYLSYVEEMARMQKISIDPLLRKGNVHLSVLDEARKVQADLIVMGGWRHSMTERDLRAREFQLILDEADVEVLVVKAAP